MGWYTDSDFPASFVREGQTFTMGYDNVILYAIWTGNPTLSVAYNANGATNGDIPADSTEYEDGESITVLGNTGNLSVSGTVFQAGACPITEAGRFARPVKLSMLLT